ncbi:MAG: alanine racemase [Caldiserica bacterium]|jgi:alanine racemase|nr:alanine racemase [Caldisericota bacterium]
MANSTKAVIDLEAIAQNVKAIKGLIGEKCHLMAVVKADGYGHGALEVGQVAIKSGATWLGVANPIEGKLLREAGIKAPILVLLPIEPEEAQIVANYGLSQTVESPSTLKVLDREAQKVRKRIRVHLKIDTGMNRLGVRCEDALKVAKEILGHPGLELEGVFSHFATADEEDKTFARFQLERFRQCLRDLERAGIRVPLKHMANSAATLELPESRLDLVRVGIMVYGVYPSNEVKRVISLRPAMTVKTKVMSIREVEPGETVSYGRAYTAKEKRKIAIIPLGYGNGYTRLFSNLSYFLIRGKKVPQVGRVCMDMCALDVTGIENIKPGEEVIVFGEGLPVDELSDLIGTISYEILCSLGRLVPRDYKNTEE